jgi:hypothetical protein
MADIIQPFENPDYRNQRRKPSIMSRQGLQNDQNLPPLPAKAEQGVIGRMVAKIVGEPKSPAEQAREQAIVEAILTRDRIELSNRVAALSAESGARLLRFIDQMYHEEESDLAEDYLAKIGQLELELAAERHQKFVTQYARRMLQQGEQSI